ncbi:MAG: hypothetical protein ACREKL_13700 [Chthoniobacterales bacterium]
MQLPRCLPLLAILPLTVAWAFIPLPDPVATSFPEVNGEVYTIAVVDSDSHVGRIYIGGNFTQVGGQPRNHAASFDLNTGTLTSWNPDVDGPVHTLSVMNGIVYLGGAFSQVGGNPRNNAAAVNAVSAAVTGWNPDLNGTVFTIEVNSGSVYLGGAFTTVGIEARAHLAGFNLANSALLPWNPGTDGDVRVLKGNGGTLYVGGDFQNVESSPRAYVAAFNVASGNLTPWSPILNGTVRAFAFDGATVFVGGDFTEINGTSHPFSAAILATSGTPLAWNPGLNGSVHAFALHTHILYPGGDFTNAGGFSRPRLAAIDSRNGHVFNWNPGANATVHAMRFVGGGALGEVDYEQETLLIGGTFSTLAGKPAAAFAGTWDSLWNKLPGVACMKVNGKSTRPAQNVGMRFYTKRSRVTLRGLAAAGYENPYLLQEHGKMPNPPNGEVSVEKVLIYRNAKNKRNTTIAQGTNHWKSVQHLKMGINKFLIVAIDTLGRDPVPIDDNPTFAELRIVRLRNGQQPPRSGTGMRPVTRPAETR